MKFISLFRKELKELLTVQVLMTMIVTVGILYVIGDVMGTVVEDVEKSFTRVTICNQDDDVLTNQAVEYIKLTGTEVTLVDLESDDYVSELKRLNLKSLVIIPDGFADQIRAGQKGDIKTISTMTSLSSMSAMVSASSSTAVEVIRAAITMTIYSDQGVSDAVRSQLEEPLNLVETTIVGDKQADISISLLQSFCETQGMVVPLVVFVLVLYASQMIMAAISTEKIDKTLETLLSAPVTRSSVLSAKMLAAGVVAALNAVVYMFGFSKMMDGVTGDMLANSEMSAIVTELGLKIQGIDYIFLGIQLFLTILIALSMSLILGALANDAKSAQTMLMPMMFLTMVPYMVTMFTDVQSLSPVLRTILYAIPFTHTFIAVETIMLGNAELFWGGVIYQFVLLCICMFVAIRIFMSDKIFTMSISFDRKSRGSKKKSLLNSFAKK